MSVHLAASVPTRTSCEPAFRRAQRCAISTQWSLARARAPSLGPAPQSSESNRSRASGWLDLRPGQHTNAGAVWHARCTNPEQRSGAMDGPSTCGAHRARKRLSSDSRSRAEAREQTRGGALMNRLIARPLGTIVISLSLSATAFGQQATPPSSPSAARPAPAAPQNPVASPRRANGYVSPWGWGPYSYGAWVRHPWHPVGWRGGWVAHPQIVVRLHGASMGPGSRVTAPGFRGHAFGAGAGRMRAGGRR